MPLTLPDFKRTSKDAIDDSTQKAFLSKARQQYSQRQSQQTHLFSNYDLAKNRAAFIRWKTIENLDKHLIQFEANCIKTGIKVLWALDDAQALVEISSIITKHNIKSITLDNGPIATELNVQQYLEKTSTVALLAINGKSSSVKSYIRNNSFNNLSLKLSDPSNSDASIMQAAFIAADTGAIIITDFNTNGTTKHINHKTTIVLAGIDSILHSLNDAELILALQSGYASATGNNSFLKIITAAKREIENNGNEVYVLLVDNGRSNLLETEQQRQSLYCIQCGACQALCPVVASIGSTGADNLHSGPLAFAALPQWKGKKDFSYLSYSSPLCGKCNEVCPVKIDFRKAMLATRQDAVKNKLNSQQEKLFYFFWKKTMLKREFINWNTINSHRKAVEAIFLKSKSGIRKLPVAKTKSFNLQWRELMGIK